MFNLIALLAYFILLFLVELTDFSDSAKSLISLVVSLHLWGGLGIRIGIKSDEISKWKVDNQEKTPSLWLEKEISRLPLEVESKLKWKKANEEFNSNIKPEKIDWSIKSIKYTFSNSWKKLKTTMFRERIMNVSGAKLRGS